jgi:hypothetical protein
MRTSSGWFAMKRRKESVGRKPRGDEEHELLAGRLGARRQLLHLARGVERGAVLHEHERVGGLGVGPGTRVLEGHGARLDDLEASTNRHERRRPSYPSSTKRSRMSGSPGATA